jgi:hypothetical protein
VVDPADRTRTKLSIDQKQMMGFVKEQLDKLDFYA